MAPAYYPASETASISDDETLDGEHSRVLCFTAQRHALAADGEVARGCAALTGPLVDNGNCGEPVVMAAPYYWDEVSQRRDVPQIGHQQQKGASTVSTNAGINQG